MLDIIVDEGMLTMRQGCGRSFPPREGVAPDEICAFCKRVIESVEEARCGGCEEIPDVLLQCIDALPAGCLCHKAVIIYGIDVLLLGHLQA